jgi:phosphohistidine phosphatase
MGKQLYLLRHADSVSKQLGGTDKERELTSNGMKESMQIGSFLLKSGVILDQIVSSTANRAKNTTQIVSDAMRADSDKILFEDNLYEASFRTFFDMLQKVEDHLNNVMFVGHNPTISYVAEYLTGEAFTDMSTCGLAVISFNFNSWKDVSKGNGKLSNYVYPAMLSTFE